MGTPGNAETPKRALRADALRNRQRIVEAASALFEERGLDVPLDEIAERAGVGAGTLYRRFPTKESLVEAVAEDKLQLWVTATGKALEHEDPWAGFTSLMEWICTTMAADRGFSDLLSIRLTNSETAARCREAGEQALAALVRRAQEAGELRSDFVPEDFLLFLIANAAVMHVTREAAPHAWRRLLAFLVEGCHAARTGPLPAAPTPLQMERALLGNAQMKGVGPCPGTS